MIAPKIYAYSVIALLLIGGLSWGYSKVWHRGYDTRVSEELVETDKRITEAVKEARRNWDESAMAGAAQIQEQSAILEKIRVVERSVEKAAASLGSCRTLSPEFVGVLNAATAAANGDGGGSPDPAPEPASRMPALPTRRE